MPSLPQSTPSPPIDLTRYTEAARRQLYDAVVALFFPESSADPEEWVPALQPGRRGPDRLPGALALVRDLGGDRGAGQSRPPALPQARAAARHAGPGGALRRELP